MCSCALKATVYYAMLSVLDHTIPANSGFFDSIEIKAEPGSLVWATEPAAVGDRETTSQRIADVIFGAFSKDGSEDGGRCRKRRHLFLLLLRKRQPNGSAVYLIETIGGGSGARYNKDGLDAIQFTHDQYLESPCRRH